MDVSALEPVDGMTHHAEREKRELSTKLARAFLEVGDGKGVEAMAAVLLKIATDPRVRARVRAHAARDYLKIAADVAAAQAAGRIGQLNVAALSLGGGGAPASQTPGREFWQATLADPAARERVLDDLSRALGVAPPVVATRPGKVETPPVIEAGLQNGPKRNPEAEGRATAKKNGSTNGSNNGTGPA